MATSEPRGHKYNLNRWFIKDDFKKDLENE